ncbi:MAG: hypothetical protein Q7R51_01620, partial [bacterium]|nr:hypothetical protein [bacterium]
MYKESREEEKSMANIRRYREALVLKRDILAQIDISHTPQTIIITALSREHIVDFVIKKGSSKKDPAEKIEIPIEEQWDEFREKVSPEPSTKSNTKGMPEEEERIIGEMARAEVLLALGFPVKISSYTSSDPFTVSGENFSRFSLGKINFEIIPSSPPSGVFRVRTVIPGIDNNTLMEDIVVSPSKENVALHWKQRMG